MEATRMKRILPALILATTLQATTSMPASAQTSPSGAITCTMCADWNAPQPAFRIAADTWYVGVRGLSAIAVRTASGVLLLDGALPQSVPLIEANLEAAGMALSDVRWIVLSHEHFDHAGGIAQLARRSGATVYASAEGAAALRRGLPAPNDPQAAYGERESAFEAVADVRVVADGEVLDLGGLALTAHYTPGHTAGATTWSWRQCDPADEGATCLDFVYADSLNAVSAPGFRFTPTAARFEASLDRLAGLPCDVVMSTHPGMTALFEKHAALARDPQANPFVEGDGCRRYAEAARQRLRLRLQQEASASSP
jgi:metallo-beta-lactamase class B